MPNIPVEQPPEEIDERLKEYLSRNLVNIDNALSTTNNLTTRYTLPLKPRPGQFFYFGAPVGPITSEGFWGFTSTGWVNLSYVGNDIGSKGEIDRWSHSETGNVTEVDFNYTYEFGKSYVLAFHSLRHNSASSTSFVLRMSRSGVFDSGANDYGVEATQRRNQALTTRAETREWMRLSTQTIAGSASGSFGAQVRLSGNAWMTALGYAEYSYVNSALNSPTDIALNYGNDSVFGVHRYRAAVDGIRLFWADGSAFDGGIIQLLEF